MRHHKRPTLPHYAKGLTIGILGGTFDPPHEGHLAMSVCALRELNLDAVWWLVSPQNPAKARQANPIEQRVACCQALTSPYKNIYISDMELALNTTRSVQTLRRLKRFNPHTTFVWLMGADNLASCHQWEYFDELFTKNKIAVFKRKCYHYGLMQTTAAVRFRRLHRKGRHTLLRNTPHGSSAKAGWVILNNPYHPASSTQIRAQHA